MAGVRSLAFLLAVTLAVAVPPGQQRPSLLSFAATSSGLQVMPREVTIEQWERCAEAGGCGFRPKAGPGAVDDSYPVTGVGMLDVEEFIAWARTETGEDLRLPSLEEWYAFSGVAPYRPTKIFTDPRLAWAATYGSEGKMDPTLKPGGGFGVTDDGIADVKGNVWEWTSTCVVANSDLHCPAYFAAGEHEAKVPLFVRDPSAGGCATGTPPAHLGFRLVVDRTS
jgi:formylglycine-generating enzyme required for sulfatase activity